MNRSAVAVALALLFIAPAQANTGNASTSQQFKDVTDDATRSEGLRVISGYLKPIFPSIAPLRCETLIVATPGKVETIYIGVCKVGGKSAMLVCGDTGVGEFAVTEWPEGGNRTTMTAFAAKNCPGG